ncbi:MAG: TolC family protein [Bacillota bacterium]
MKQVNNGLTGFRLLKGRWIWFALLLLVILTAVWLGQPVFGSPEGPKEVTLQEAQNEARDHNRQIEMTLRSLRIASLNVDLIEEELESLEEERDELEELDFMVDLEIPVDELYEGLGLDELLAELNLEDEFAEEDLEDEVITIPVDIESEALEEFIGVKEIEDAITELETEKAKAERGVRMARLGRYEAIEEVKLGVLEIITGIIVLDEQLATQKETLQRMEKMFRMELEKYYAGTVTEVEVEEMRSQLRELESAIDMMENKRQETIERFADFIGRSPDADLQLDPYQPDQPRLVDYKDLLAKELGSNYAVRRKELEVKNAHDDKELARELHGSDSPQYEIAEEELALARLEREEERMNTRHELLSDYHEVKETEQELSDWEEDLKLAEIKYEKAKVSYNQGHITNTELALARLELMEGEMSLEEARYDYHVALARLKAIQER